MKMHFRPTSILDFIMVNMTGVATRYPLMLMNFSQETNAFLRCLQVTSLKDASWRPFNKATFWKNQVLLPSMTLIGGSDAFQ